jgi:hypothetical protein
MALLTDGNISSLDDLRRYDSAVLAVADAEQIDLAGKIELATAELGIEIDEFLAWRLGEARGTGLGNVVVTAPLKQWHTLRVLSHVYGDAQGNHVSGRYALKWAEYSRRAAWASATLYGMGVGICATPVPRAKKPQVRTVPGPAAPVAYHVRVAWRNSFGETGAASEAVIHVPEPSGLIAVLAVEAPAGAVGFDVYAGSGPEEISRQNDRAVPAGSEWFLPDTGLIVGAEPPEGQAPDWYIRNDRVLHRG